MKPKKVNAAKQTPRFYTFGLFAGCSDQPTRIYEGRVCTFDAAWKRCEVLAVRHNNKNIQFI